MRLASELDLGLVQRIEAHAVRAWPASVCQEGPDGWIMRATPGLDRGRSNNALTPARSMSAEERERGLEAVARFAERHGIRPGIQVSPLDLHGPLTAELEERGWQPWSPVLVLAGGREALLGYGSGTRLEVSVSAEATDGWLEAWAACEPGRDIAAHADTVFRRLAGRARFAQWRGQAVGVAVEEDGLIGLFCLAVAPSLRRQGLGSALVRGILAQCAAPMAYLQVGERNTAGRALYDRLGFERVYTYRHCVAPA